MITIFGILFLLVPIVVKLCAIGVGGWMLYSLLSASAPTPQRGTGTPATPRSGPPPPSVPPRSSAGPLGPKLKRADVVAMVDDQLTYLRRQIDVQVTRMGQIQQQLDQIHSVVKKLLQQDQDSG